MMRRWLAVAQRGALAASAGAMERRMRSTKSSAKARPAAPAEPVMGEEADDADFGTFSDGAPTAAVGATPLTLDGAGLQEALEPLDEDSTPSVAGAYDEPTTSSASSTLTDEAVAAAVDHLLDDLLLCKGNVLKLFARNRGAKSNTKSGLIRELIAMAGSEATQVKTFTAASRLLGSDINAAMGGGEVGVRSAWTDKALEASQLEAAAQRMLKGGSMTRELHIAGRRNAVGLSWMLQRLTRAYQDDYAAVSLAAVGGVYRQFKEEAFRIFQERDATGVIAVFAACLVGVVRDPFSASLMSQVGACERMAEMHLVRPAVDTGDVAFLERLMAMHDDITKEVSHREKIFGDMQSRVWGTDVAEILLESTEHYVERHKDWDVEVAPRWATDLASQFTNWEAIVRNDLPALAKAPPIVFDMILINVAAVRLLRMMHGEGSNIIADIPAAYRRAARLALEQWAGEEGADEATLKLINYCQVGGTAAARGDKMRASLFDAISSQLQSSLIEADQRAPRSRVTLILREAAAAAQRCERCASTVGTLVRVTEDLSFHLRFQTVFNRMNARDRTFIRTHSGLNMYKTLIKFEKDMGVTPPSTKTVSFMCIVLFYLCCRTTNSRPREPSAAGAAAGGDARGFSANSTTAVPAILERFDSVTGREELGLVRLIERKTRSVDDIRVALPPQLTYQSWLDADNAKSIYSIASSVAVKGATNDLMLASQAPMIKALDAVSKVPWRVNKYMLYVQEAIMQEGYGFGKIRAGFYPLSYCRMKTGEIPGSPDPNEKLWNMNQRGLYDAQYAKDWRDLQDVRSSRVHYLQALRQARALVDHERVYFPNSMDFRGRMYPLPGRLNHTGSDPFRALLENAEPKELGVSGLYWLKVHLANKMGMNKLTFDERVQYVDENVEDVVRSADAPLTGNRWWQQGAEPLQALMACKEVADALKYSEGPTKFPSRLPVAVDGSYNGLQHYSAIGRDEIGAKLVNLIPSDRPADAYTGILEEMMKSIRADAARDHEVAVRCLGTGKGTDRNHIKRKTIKRPIMTQVYGVTAYGMGEQIAEELIKQNQQHGLWSLTDIKEMSAYIRDKVLESLGITFRETQQCRSWLDRVARLVWSCQPTGLRCAFTWTTPLGLIVRQPYRKGRQTNLFSAHGFSRINAGTIEPADRKQISALAPNLIHSLDATHLAMTALEMQRRDLSMMAVHDSYWCHAADLPTLSSVLREQFVALYDNYDPLWELKEQWEEIFFFDLRRHGARLPDPPKRGSLVLSEVLNSHYFFS